MDASAVAKFGPGDYFGEMALLESREFWSLLDASPSITRKLLVAFAQRERANATIRT